MLYQGIIGGGSSPVEPEDLSPVLLWTNSNPGATFNAQTVSLDLTEYVGVIVEFNRASASDAQTFANRSFIKKGETGLGGGNTVAATPASRNVSCSNTGVTFEGGYSGGDSNNNAVIPTKIYGVKEYVVEPVDVQTVITNIKTGYTESNKLQTLTVNCGFKPKEVVVIQNAHGGYINNSKKCYEYSDSNGVKESTALNITDNGFTMLSSVSFNWIAYN